MKPLSAIEPRIPIESLPASSIALHRISDPGSYYLTQDLAGQPDFSGIEIASDHVTLDLRGFNLRGVSNSDHGILVSGTRRGIAIFNGSISEWGLSGIDATKAHNSQLRDLRAFDNGLIGMALGISGVIIGCSAMDNGTDGIVADAGGTITASIAARNGQVGTGDGIDAGDGSVLQNCSARDNAGAGIFVDLGCTVVHSSSRDNHGDGILAGGQTIITTCAVSFNDGDGIHGGDGSTIHGCTSSLNGGDGIEVTSFCRVSENTCNINGLLATSAVGIRATGLDNRIEANHVVLNGKGILVSDVGNLIVRNSAMHNGAGAADDYMIAGGNTLGPVSTDAATAGPWANFR